MEGDKMSRQKCGCGLKNAWCVSLSLASIALFVFSILTLFRQAETKSLWDITISVFSVLGVLLTAGTVVPAIFSYFSYKTIQDKTDRVEKTVKTLDEKLLNLHQEIEEKLPNLEAKFKQVSSMLYREHQKKEIYELLHKDKPLTQSEKDTLFYNVETLGYLPYDCSIYEFIAIKQQEIDLYEGQIVQEEAEFGEIRSKNYQDKLKTLKQELLELYRLAALVDDLFKPRYLEFSQNLMN